MLSNGLGLSQRLPATLLFDYPSVAAITDYLASKFLPVEDEAPVSDVHLSQADLDEIACLSDEEAEAMLLEELGKE